MNIPAMVVRKRLPDGTPIRAACPLCNTEFSTEAFDEDAAYPHQAKLQEQYAAHFEVHTVK